MKVVVALCTRERPRMLQECICSIQKLKLPENWKLHLVVVENGNQPNCEERIVNQLKTTPHIGYTYKLEREIGISSARNTSIEEALNSDPDWIAFIDDDEQVPEEWLINFNTAMQMESADAYTGPVERVLTEEAPIWYKSSTKLNYKNLSILDTAATNNTLANANLFNGVKMNLRFDESLNFSGGEDIKLFTTVSNNGGVIRFVADTLVYEYRTSQRTRISWLIKGEYQAGIMLARYWVETQGRLKALKNFTFKQFIRLFHGSLFTIWGIIILPFSRRYIRYLVKGLCKFAWVVGLVAGYFNATHKKYKYVIDGY